MSQQREHPVSKGAPFTNGQYQKATSAKFGISLPTDSIPVKIEGGKRILTFHQRIRHAGDKGPDY